MNTTAVTWSREDSIQHIRLTNPDRHNPLVPESVLPLRQALFEGRDAKAVLVTAEGRHFSAGGDHAALEALNDAEYADYVTELTGLFEDLAVFPAPIVGAIQGASIGGGFQLALQFDLVVAAETAYFSLPQVQVGIPISAMVYANLRARSGLGVARRMVLLGQRVDATEALAHGIVDDVVPQEDLETIAHDLATTLASRPRRAVREAREALRWGFPHQEDISYSRH
jgi:enoyl-CoA hydratase/carnithine racemase